MEDPCEMGPYAERSASISAHPQTCGADSSKVDLILGCDSVLNVARLAWISCRRPLALLMYLSWVNITLIPVIVCLNVSDANLWLDPPALCRFFTTLGEYR